jgi:hypothetical protein
MRLAFTDFPVTWNIISLPEGLKVYRATSSQPQNATLPRFFGNYNVANGYAIKYNSPLFECEIKKGVKLVDIRTLKYLVLETMIELQYKDRNMYMSLQEGFTNFMNAYGLRSHTDQLYYTETAYSNDGRTSPYKISDYPNKLFPIEYIGSRISYGPVDDKACAFLASILGHIIDGYISPNLPTPWHTKGYFDNEICLFNPNKCIETAVDIKQATSNRNVYMLDAEFELKDFLLARNKVAFAGVKYDNLPVSLAGGGPQNVNSGIGKGQYTNLDLGVNVSNTEISKRNSGTIKSVVNTILTNVKLGDVWKKLEDDIEMPYAKPNAFKFQCTLAQNEVLKTFMANIVVDVTKILYYSFHVVISDSKSIKKRANIINTIQYHFRPIIDVDVTNAGTSAGKSSSNVYVLKPGMVRLDKNRIIQKIVDEEKDVASLLLKEYSLNEMMGAVYGVLTHAGIFSLMFQACVSLGENDIKANEILGPLKQRFEKVGNFLKNMFGLGDSIDIQHDLVTLLQNGDLITEKMCNSNNTCEQIKVYEINKGNIRNIILDMIIANTEISNNISIVRKNLNNQDYIRVRSQKQVKSGYIKTSPAPSCPVFFAQTNNREIRDITTQNVVMVDGDEWYSVNANGFFRYVMNKNNRVSKAGPSGSTFMWMNMLFGLMGKETTEQNLKLLLLCIVSDFVPIYHSLTEVLLVFSREILSYSTYETKPTMYNIDQNPVEWFAKYILGGDVKLKKGDISEFSDMINTYINEKLTLGVRGGGQNKKIKALPSKSQKLKVKPKKK